MDVAAEQDVEALENKEEEQPQEEEQRQEQNGGDEQNLAQNQGAVKEGTDEAPAARATQEQIDAGGKLFIGGLSWETTQETLEGHFGKYGKIIDCVIMKDKHTGHPRGFGFVTFEDKDICDTVVKEKHVIDGRQVEAKKSVPREDIRPKTKKIFVGGLSPAVTEEEFKAYFEKYGTVTEHQIMVDHATKRSRGFGFVTFESESSVEDILRDGRTHKIGDKEDVVHVSKSKELEIWRLPLARLPGSRCRIAALVERRGGVCKVAALMDGLRLPWPVCQKILATWRMLYCSR
eukprot:jgi/Mesvir1/7843/Mv11777-RA.1